MFACISILSAKLLMIIYFLGIPNPELESSLLNNDWSLFVFSKQYLYLRWVEGKDTKYIV